MNAVSTRLRLSASTILEGSSGAGGTFENFIIDSINANVQYGDWYGEAKADNADIGLLSVRDLLIQRGLIAAGEFVFAFRMVNAENTILGGLAGVYLTAYVVAASDRNSLEEAIAADPIECRKVETELTIPEFMALFKRFSVALSLRGLHTIGRNVSIPDE